MPPLDCQKSPAGLFDRFFAVSCAHNLAPSGAKFHTWSLRSVFCQVHAPAENGFHFICRPRRQTLRGFFDKHTPGWRLPAGGMRYASVSSVSSASGSGRLGHLPYIQVMV